MKKTIATLGILTALGAGATLPVVPEEMHWKYSYETVTFDTASGWIEKGQFARDIDGDGLFVCSSKDECSPEIPLREERNDFDTSGLTEAHIVGRQSFDYFESSITKEQTRYQGDYAEYLKLQKEADYPQPKRSELRSIGSYLVERAEAAIARDVTTEAGPASNATSQSWSHVVTSSGSDRILMVFVNTNDTSSTERLVTLITYNGVQMSTTTTRYAQATVEGAPFHLVNPATGSHTVSVTLGGITSTVISASISMTGVDQTNPFVQNAITCAFTGCSVVNASSTSMWLHHIVANSNDLNDAVPDETCLYSRNEEWDQDTGSGALGNYGMTCGPAIPNAAVNRLGIDATGLSNTTARAYEIRNASPIATATSTNITYTTADLYGILYGLNGETAQDVFFNYGTSPGVYTATTTLEYKNSVPQEFTASLSGLSHSTTYYYRVGMQASSSALVYDTEGKFTTPCNPAGTTCIDEYTMETGFHPQALTLGSTQRRYGSWTAPTGVTSADVACWGGGGGGGFDSTNGGGGGGGGAFASSTVSVTEGTTYWITIGAYGSKDSASNVATSTFATTTVVADGAIGTTGQTGGRGGLASLSTGDVVADGGDGGTGDGTNDVGGGGGGAGGPHGAGNDGVSPGAAATEGGAGGSGDAGSGGAAGTAGNGASGGEGGTSNNGGGGGGGSDTSTHGGRAGQYGGGGGGADLNTSWDADNSVGGGGRCTVTYSAAAGGGDPDGGPAIFFFKNGDVRVKDSDLRIKR